MTLEGKTVLLGVTGSIAAYKIAYLASTLKKRRADVHVLMTKNATNFINPITFETLTGNKCLVEFDAQILPEIQLCTSFRQLGQHFVLCGHPHSTPFLCSGTRAPGVYFTVLPTKGRRPLRATSLWHL